MAVRLQSNLLLRSGLETCYSHIGFVLGLVLILGIGFAKYGLGLVCEFVKDNVYVFFSSRKLKV